MGAKKTKIKTTKKESKKLVAKIKTISADDLYDSRKKSPKKKPKNQKAPKGSLRERKKSGEGKRPPFILFLFLVIDIALIGYLLYRNASINNSLKTLSSKLFTGAPAQKTNGPSSFPINGIPLDNIDTFVMKTRKTFTSSKYGYSVGYLADWNIASSSEEKFSVYKNADKKTPPYFTITVLKNPPNLTMEMTATNDVAMYKGYAAVNTIYFIYPNTMKVRVDRSKNGNKVDPTYSEILYVGNGKNYVFKMEATANSKSEFEDERLDFENNFASFKIVQ